MAEIEAKRELLKKAKRTVEKCASISMTELQEHGVLTAQEPVKWSQQTKGGLLPQIVAQLRGDRAVIVAAYFDPKGEVRATEALVTVSWSDCHFGGKRAWFLCPAGSEPEDSCGRRVARLYLSEEGGFMCRQCAALRYQSDHLSSRERPLHRAQKILRRLGGSGRLADGFPPRPKGMHNDIYHSSQWKVHNLLEEYGHRGLTDLSAL